MSFSFFDNLPSAVTLVLGLLLVVWLILLLLVPFMIESIRGWTRRSCQELEEMNHKLDVLTTLLGGRPEVRRDAPPGNVANDFGEELDERGPAAGRYDDAERADRKRGERVVRKEPTI